MCSINDNSGVPLYLQLEYLLKTKLLQITTLCTVLMFNQLIYVSLCYKSYLVSRKDIMFVICYSLL